MPIATNSFHCKLQNSPSLQLFGLILGFFFYFRKYISLPENVKHNVHVDLDYNWTGEDPNHAFSEVKKLGEG